MGMTLTKAAPPPPPRPHKEAPIGFRLDSEAQEAFDAYCEKYDLKPGTAAAHLVRAGLGLQAAK